MGAGGKIFAATEQQSSVADKFGLTTGPIRAIMAADRRCQMRKLPTILLMLIAAGCNGVDTRSPWTGTGEVAKQIIEQPGIVDGWYLCHRVVDADTIILSNVGRVRLAGVDAPELDTPAGIAARDELAARIEGQPVHVRFCRRRSASTAGPANTIIHDRFGRLLGRLAEQSSPATLEK